MRFFAGYDWRETQGFHVFVQSMIDTRSALPLEALSGDQGDGSNEFTYARFSVPERCGWSGPALFVDGSDMQLRANLGELAALFDPTKAVQVVKHDYRTKHARKYVGTAMEAANADYPRKNWSSVILWNCGHLAHFQARERMRQPDGMLHRFPWLEDSEIGELPVEWNWLADEYGENPQAKLLHWTAGIPGFAHYRDAPHASEWHAAAARARGETEVQA